MKTLWNPIFAPIVLLGLATLSTTGCNTCIPCGEAVWQNSSPANHASWMETRLPTLGGRELSRLVLPASHDAAMYRGWNGYGKTQCLSIYDQLSYGIRWFDLRPEWTGSKFRIHHGIVSGPEFLEVVKDIRKFASEDRHELILLKLTDFRRIDHEAYVKLVAVVTNALGPWLFTNLPNGKRLSSVTLSEYVRSGPRILVLVDSEFAIRHPVNGIWVYGDWDSPHACCADLCVYDVYSNTTDFDRMSADQFRKFKCFRGKCRDGTTDCDLFLLSWTLTPCFRIWAASQPAIHHLKNSLEQFPVGNQHSKIINLIYVDFVEFSDVTEVAIIQNGRLEEISARERHP